MDSKKAYKILKTASGQAKFLKDAWNDFNDYADKHKWVRPAATAAAAGLGGAGLGALLGGGRGSLAGGAIGMSLGGAGGYIWEKIARDQYNKRLKAKLLAAKRKLFTKDQQRIKDQQSADLLNLAKDTVINRQVGLGAGIGASMGTGAGAVLGAMNAAKGKRIRGSIKGGLKGALLGGFTGTIPGLFANDLNNRML